MNRTTKELIKGALADPVTGIPLLAAESREAIRANDTARARSLGMTLLSLSVDRARADPANRDLVAWLIEQRISLQIVLWSAIFARMIGDVVLEDRALNLARESPLAE